jgi:signal transduction histidine kinase
MNQHRILVLDDDLDHLESIRRAFESTKEGKELFILEVVETVRAAKTLVRQRVPDLAIIDWRLSDGSGMELLPGYGRVANFPVILMTSYGSPDAEADVLSKGAVDYIQKELPSIRKLPELCTHVLRFWKHLKRERGIGETIIDRAHRLSDLGMVAGGMVHDLNNKLTSVKRGAELVLEDVRSATITTQTTTLLEMIVDSAQKSQTLTKRILDNSIHSHRKRVFDLLTHLESVSRTLRSIISGAIEIHIDFTPVRNRNVNVDPLELELVITNLVKNAEEAMGTKSGRIRLCVDEIYLPQNGIEISLPRGTYLRIQISDNGHGIGKEKLPHIFEPFFTTKADGTGLGLARAKTFFELNSGDIIVESVWNQGTTFQLFLPVSGEVIIENSMQANLPIALQGQGEHLVIVDDEESLLPGLAIRLERWNYKISKFGDPEEACDYILNHAKDVALVITDYLMPGLTGVELRKRLLSSGNPMPKMILMTGRQDQMTEQRAIKEGFDFYVEKPGDDTDLSLKLRRALNPPEI